MTKIKKTGSIEISSTLVNPHSDILTKKLITNEVANNYVDTLY
jgi:hypothetical protein